MSVKLSPHPIDRAALAMIGLLSTAIAVLVGGHITCQAKDQCWFANRPRVQSFTWHDQELGAKDRAFILTFDRPMDRKSVEENLRIIPPLPGKISWVGRKMAYTLERSIPYGERYELRLSGAEEHFVGSERNGKAIHPFVSQFRSRDQAFAYIGTEGVEQGRIIFYNSTEQTKTLLTPANLTVVDFKFYTQKTNQEQPSLNLLFSAASRDLGFEGLRQLNLYSTPVVQTEGAQSISEPSLILNNQGFQNNQFDVSDDGETIVVQRINRDNPIDFDLWMIRSKQEPERLKVTGGDFRIAPDNQSLAVARGEGVGILPLQPEAKPLDFLPKFGQLLNFSPDGTSAALVNFNTNDPKRRFQRSLFYVNNQGHQKELLTTEGSILNCQFTGNNRYLYCLITELVEAETYEEKPYFTQINLKTGKITPLLQLTDFRETTVSLSPDNRHLLFDQVLVHQDIASESSLSTGSGESVAAGRLWLLTPPSQDSSASTAKLQQLPLAGIRPRWAP